MVLHSENLHGELDSLLNVISIIIIIVIVSFIVVIIITIIIVVIVIVNPTEITVLIWKPYPIWCSCRCSLHRRRSRWVSQKKITDIYSLDIATNNVIERNQLHEAFSKSNGRARGGTQQIFIRGGSAQRSNPLPFNITFFTKKEPLSYTLY